MLNRDVAVDLVQNNSMSNERSVHNLEKTSLFYEFNADIKKLKWCKIPEINKISYNIIKLLSNDNVFFNS